MRDALTCGNGVCDIGQTAGLCQFCHVVYHFKQPSTSMITCTASHHYCVYPRGDMIFHFLSLNARSVLTDVLLSRVIFIKNRFAGGATIEYQIPWHVSWFSVHIYVCNFLQNT